MKHLLIYNLLIITSSSLIGMEENILKNRYENSIHKVMKKAEEEKNILLYKKCIVKLLPREICKQIDAIYAFLHNEKIKESFIKNIDATGKSYNRDMPKLIINNNGHYYAHDVSVHNTSDSGLKVHGIENNTQENQFLYEAHKPLCFSPDNNCYITKEPWGTFFNNINKRSSHHILGKEEQCFGVTINNDGQHILFETRKRESTPIYKLWSLDEQGSPQPTFLMCDLPYAKKVIFHPNNKQLIINYGKDQLYLYTIADWENKIIKPTSDRAVYAMDKLTLTSDNKKILAKRNLTSKHDYTLINIENLDNVTSVIIPAQSCYETKELPMLHIPCKNMLTYITKKGHTLNLLDEKAQLIASDVITNNAHITALAVDNSGGYLAAGYSDGTIMIWHLFDIKQYPCEKIFIKSKGSIKKLTFSENQLLLSQSESGKFWDTSEPTSNPSNATLWDVYGNEIINFGNNVIKSIMSPNGKTIITISAKLEKTDDELSPWQRFLTLTTYHNKNQTTQYTRDNNLTLSQLYMLMTKDK